MHSFSAQSERLISDRTIRVFLAEALLSPTGLLTAVCELTQI
jgi:hypothetical protein